MTTEKTTDGYDPPTQRTAEETRACLDHQGDGWPREPACIDCGSEMTHTRSYMCPARVEDA